MKTRDIIAVLESVKRREIQDNNKINKLCVNPSESVGVEAIDAAITKLAEYENAEEQGRLIVLPCKVGDKIFGFKRFINKPWEIYESVIYGIRISKTGIKIYGTKTHPISPYDIDGVDLFDNRPEAEAALAEKMNNNTMFEVSTLKGGDGA